MSREFPNRATLDLSAVAKGWLSNWLKPRSLERDEAFRESVIRSTLAIMLVLVILSFASTIFVFKSRWELISFPTLHVGVFFGCFISAIAVTQKR